MLYKINNKCYINIAPSIYVEVNVSKDGKITPTKNKIEVNSNIRVGTTTLEEEIKKTIKTETRTETYAVNRKHNKRKK